MTIRIKTMNLYRDSDGNLKGKLMLASDGLGEFEMKMSPELVADVVKLSSERTVDKWIEGFRSGLIESVCE